jgi:hypothetical protein
LALLAVDHAFAQGLANPLSDTPDDLPFNQSRVDDLATIMHPDVAQDFDLTGLPIDLHYHSMRSEGDGGVW